MNKIFIAISLLVTVAFGYAVGLYLLPNPDPDRFLVNLSLHKPATQSSLYYSVGNRDASFGVDGKITGG